MLRDVLLDSHAWFQINSQLQVQFKVPKEQSVFIFKGLGQAVYDVIYGTALFNAHKKSVAFVRGNANCFEPLMPIFYKLAYNVQTARLSQISNVSNNVSDWVQALKTDTAFVVLAEDHPVTGELNPFTDELETLLNQKRIFTIRISHHNHYEKQIEIQPYSVRICSYGSQYAIAWCGSRFKAPMPTAPMMNWSMDISSILADINRKPYFSKDLIERRALDLPATYTRFKSGPSVLEDRLLIQSNEISADRLLALAEKINGRKLLVESTQPCHSHLWNHYSQWWENVPSAEDLRGLLILPVEAIQEEAHWRALHQAADEALKTSSWD